ncbi:enoyl-CoA hydratase-related protein [Aquabacterium sp. J223]|uniref:enoyl-CoA hydratase-related protein n=1 Tax=Aquabacterium sp. J223 TaxID=2898431 RepID=UPI0021ADAF0E|nr:enoyl-CoA hydratase-related protein [Aquabacterium sp. J223]UUX97371.1 enoyl-CoA hydratase-related protein [Aquabacterium sp. J223]
MTDDLLYAVNKGIAVITINRPQRRNALTRAVREGLAEAFKRFEADPQAQVAILTGAGDTFCAGMDLLEAADTELRIPPPGFMPVLGDNIEVTKPVIAAVQGYAYAGGFLLAQMCDLCVADETARFAITEGKVGRGMPWAAPLIHMLPQRVVMEIALTGDPLTAQRAYELGYVNRVVPKGQALESALELAGRVTVNAPLTVRAAKEMVRLSTEMGRSAALRASYRAFDSVYLSEDALEGPRSFREKRKPVWKGR